MSRSWRLYATATLGVILNRADFLGTAYMQLEIGNDRSGQFFTPPEVSRMMAEMTFTGMEEHIKAKGYVTVDEPAAGAGGMLIEAANTLQRPGFDPRATMLFRAADIDRTCFNLAYFQLSTLGLCGEVIHGNTLSLEEWDRRATPQLLLVNAGPAPPLLNAVYAPPREAEDSPSQAPARDTAGAGEARRQAGTANGTGFRPPAGKDSRTARRSPATIPDSSHRAQYQQRDDAKGIDR